MTFQFQWVDQEIRPEDFDRLRRAFSKTVADLLPCGSVHFFPLADAGKDTPPITDPGLPEVWTTGIKMVAQQRKPVADAVGACLYLPIWQGEEIIAVTIAGNGDAALFEASLNWLLERSRIISREFNLIKQWAVDPVTGLLNGRHFLEELKMILREQREMAVSGVDRQEDDRPAGSPPPSTFALLEVFQRSADAEKAMQYGARVASYLESLIGGYSPLHYLGSGVYGLIWEGVAEDQAARMGDALLRRLKQENFTSAHMGIAPVERRGLADQAIDNHKWEARLLNHAWLALQTARKRGPYALCTFLTLEEIKSHPLRPAPAAITKALPKLWRGTSKFALILLCRDQKDDTRTFSKRFTALLGPKSFLPVDSQEAYIFLGGMDGQQATAWLGEFKKRALAAGEIIPGEVTCSAGIAQYPCPGFHKAEIADNARKALIHAGFFGPDSMAAFDDVSLNISGDIYYNEGNLDRAIREYRQGLGLKPANINLLNSLGVIHAQMNRYHQAIPLFKQVLEVDRADFMGLFNLGSAYAAIGNAREATLFFEKALKKDDRHFDLLLQLGKLYCQLKKFSKSITLLEKAIRLPRPSNPWSKAARQDMHSGKTHKTSGGRDAESGEIYRILGESYKGLGDNKLAEKNLQRAIRNNPRDAAAISLLGEIYAEERQGHDIALSMCVQATELDHTKWEYWARLGRVQLMQDDARAAIVSLKQSLQRHARNPGVMLALGRAYEKDGHSQRARQIYEKILRLDQSHKQAARTLAAIRKQAGRKKNQGRGR